MAAHDTPADAATNVRAAKLFGRPDAEAMRKACLEIAESFIPRLLPWDRSSDGATYYTAHVQGENYAATRIVERIRALAPPAAIRAPTGEG